MSVALCKFYSQGDCRFGSSCRFLHSNHRVPNTINQVPSTINRVPNTINRVPNTIMQVPNTITRYHDKYRSKNNDFKNKIPGGWMNCPNHSLELIANKFVAFKTPLDDNYRIPVKKRFNIKTLVSSMFNKRVRIGLWIDLTNTERYFNKSNVKEMGCIYVKIPCVGHNKPPTRNEVGHFIEVCWRFWNENSSIGVHCTHGYNRTGFMIVSFLVEVFNLHVSNAIHVFEAARPPGIYRQYLIDELFRRYSDEEPLQIIELPNWD